MLRFSAIALLVLASQATAALVDPAPPRFPDQYSAHVDLSQLGPSGRVEKTQACDFAWDLKANATSYRNCGWKGTQMQVSNSSSNPLKPVLNGCSYVYAGSILVR
jgi:hypothetical protein